MSNPLFRMSFTTDSPTSVLQSLSPYLVGDLQIDFIGFTGHLTQKVAHKPTNGRRKAAKAAKTRKAKKAKTASAVNSGPLGTQNQRVEQLIMTRGIPPFRLRDLVHQARSIGLPTPAVMRTVKRQLDSGQLTKIEPGVYQKTGQAYAEEIQAAQ